MTTNYAMLSGSEALSDPVGPSPLAHAALWMQQAMLGTVATTVAIIAVASIGFLMLTGRVNVRRSATVVIGCFILFGAPTIAAGLRALADARSSVPRAAMTEPAPITIPQTRSPSGYDPYAGASVPEG